MKAFEELPLIHFRRKDILSGNLSSLQAAWACALGPIYKRRVESGHDAGEDVFMVGPEANRFVLHTSRTAFSHDLGWSPLIGQGLLNMDLPDHGDHRKVWSPAFNNPTITTYLPCMQRIIADRLNGWADRSEIDVYDEARQITFDIAAQALGGKEPGAITDQLRRDFAVLLRGFDPYTESREQFQARADAARRQMQAAVTAMITEGQQSYQGACPGSALAHGIQKLKLAGTTFSDEQFLGHMNILLAAGHDTTTILSAWALYLLAIFPSWRQRITHEIEDQVDQDDQLTADGMHQTPVLDAFLKEVGRLYPPVLHLPRIALENFTFAYTIPAGTRIRLALGASHRLPHVFAEPNRFDPSRFLAPRQEDKRQPYGLITFGGGPRTCIGIAFARVEVKSLIAHALRRYDLRAIPNQQLVHPGFIVALVPQGIRLGIRPHGTG